MIEIKLTIIIDTTVMMSSVIISQKEQLHKYRRHAVIRILIKTILVVVKVGVRDVASAATHLR